MKIKEKYLIDPDGNRIGVLLDMEEYQKILEALEELEAILAYDNAINDEEISFDVTISEIEKCRQ